MASNLLRVRKYAAKCVAMLRMLVSAFMIRKYMYRKFITLVTNVPKTER